MNNLVGLVTENYNRNTVAVLSGILDQEMPEVSVAFLQSGPDLSRQVRELATRHQQMALCFSFMTPQLLEVANTLESLRPLPDNITLIAGGPHASGDPAGTLQLGFRVAVIGEGERTFPELLRHLFAGGSYDDVAGIAYLCGVDGNGDTQLVRSPHRPWVDLDDYPPFSVAHNKLAAVELTRGCPHACHFCQTSFFLGGHMRHRSVENVVYWLRRAREELGLRYARFVSSNCLCYGSADGRRQNLEQVERLLYESNNLVGKENVFFGSFPSELRPESVTKEGMALIKKYCANDNVVIGAQSGSPHLLRLIHRGHSEEDVFRAAEIVVAAGLRCIVDFILGLPGETAKDRQLTLAVIQRLTQIGAVISTHFFIPLPGTPLAQAAPGAPDRETVLFLENLTSERLDVGRWKGRLETLAAVNAGICGKPQPVVR